jgi:hypothetical protein
LARLRSRISRRRGDPPRWAAYALMAVMIAGVLGVGGLLAWRRATAVVRDKVSSCPITGPVAVHAVLVDNSDPLTPLQAQRLAQRVEIIAHSAALDERVDYYLLTAGGDAVAAPEVSLCRPPSDGNALTENPERIRRAYVAKYLEPLRGALRNTETPQESATSPIMESIKAVCVGAFGALPSGVPARLTIASDMIENTRVLNQYRPYETNAFLRSTPLSGVLADCHGAEVDILYLTRLRDSRFQTRAHQQFWEKFLDRMNARLMSMERI